MCIREPKVSQPLAATLWNFYTDMSYSCPRGLRLLASWEPNHVLPETLPGTSQQCGTPRGLRGHSIRRKSAAKEKVRSFWFRVDLAATIFPLRELKYDVFRRCIIFLLFHTQSFFFQTLRRLTQLRLGPTSILRDSSTSLSRLQKLTVLYVLNSSGH